MKSKVSIFIGTYKIFTPRVSNDSYTVIYGNHDLSDCPNNYVKCTSDSELDDKFFSEIYMLRNIPENVELGEYVGFCHYRKYFGFMDNIPDLDEAFKKCDIIVGEPIRFTQTIKKQYASCHNIDDLEIVTKIIEERYPSYVDLWNSFLNGKLMFPYNMFIMRRDEFYKYIDFVTNILDSFVDEVGTDIRKRIEDNKDKYIKSFPPNNTFDYQYRIGGYLAERLTNLWIIKNHKRIMISSIKITEDKY